MKKILVLVVILIFLLFPNKSFAVYDPLSVPNNKIGVHILFPTELDKARELINSSGGDWGYVTIPIQAGDKDLKKWQDFMNDARTLHLIPIVRLATEGDYFNKATWRKPTDADILDFANFLSSLNWPTKNRYIVVFNEVNRSDEWNGEANPAEYARILSYAVTLFKSKSPDFFIISSGMDNASISRNGSYSQYDYFKLMNDAVPGIFNQFDGFASHSYPNPGFISSPDAKTRSSISSFILERDEINSMSSKKLPVFITETGWDQSKISDKQVGDYFKQALDGAWNDPGIVAITPFLLNAGPGPFEKFSLVKNDGNKNEVFKAIESYQKIKGSPFLTPAKKVLATQDSDLPTKDFSDSKENDSGREIKYFVKWLLLPL